MAGWDHGTTRRRRRWAAGTAVVAVAALIMPLSDGGPVAADPVDDQREQVAQITDELERLEEASDILAEDYVTAIDEQNRLNGEVAAAEQRVTEREAEVSALRGDLAQVAVQSFMGAGTNGLGPMFNDSTASTERLQREQLSRVALSSGTATTDELDEAVLALRTERAALEDKLAEAAELAAEVDASRQATDERKAEYVGARADAEALLGDLIQEEEERRARESYERQQAAERAAAETAAQQAADDRAQAESQAAAPPSGGDDTDGDDTDGDGDGEGRGGGGAAQAAASFDIPPASSRAQTAVNAAMSQLGVPYQFAQASPGEAFDCSGLTSWAWSQAGVSLPHQSRAQFGSVAQVPMEAAQPGDLIFYYSPISHVGIYLGNGQLVHAPNSGSVVNVANVNWGKVTGVGRPG